MGNESAVTAKDTTAEPARVSVGANVSVDLSHQPFNGDWCFESNPYSRTALPINRLVGDSRIMMRLRARILRYAETEETVLISGETGTGKELIARLLHELSPRCNAPFVPVNCAAIPGPLAESELFGNTRGAYTGAIKCRSGLLSRANGGTLFLDELGELAIEVQSKLLRTLELGTYRPVGANREQRTDVRVVAATNRDLEQSVLRGEFRADLYYRINVLQIIAPPLREHRRDIPLIAGAMLTHLLPAGRKVRVTGAVMNTLISAPWMGNVRELRNVLRRSLVMSREGIIEQLDRFPNPSDQELAIAQAKSQRTARLIDALTRHRGQLDAVAREFRVSVRTIQRRAKESGLRPRDFRRI